MEVVTNDLSINTQSKTIKDIFDVKFIKDLPSDFIYVIIACAILYLCTRVVKINLGHIFALGACYIIITNLRKKELQENVTFNQETDYRLELLGSPSHFHMDINIINLFYNIYGWRQRNANNFDHAIKAVNNVLRIDQETSIPLQRCVDNYEIAYDQTKIAMNMMHGFVYAIDHPLLVKKLKKVLVRLNQLLERHLQNIQKNCEKTEAKKESVDVNTRYIEDAIGPKAYDGTTMSQFDYY